jgi:hypothetical protein
MEQDFILKNARTYASRHQLELAERLGFGVHGIIFVAENKSKSGKTAVKAHREFAPYTRERAVYERLQQAGVAELVGFNVPQLVAADDSLRVIEMSIVTRPFVLDFAGAYLDAPPVFPEDVWVEWEAGKREQFENRWPAVEAVLAALKELNIYMVDVSPSNIGFPGGDEH